MALRTIRVEGDPVGLQRGYGGDSKDSYTY